LTSIPKIQKGFISMLSNKNNSMLEKSFLRMAIEQ
jgi:hypothetical protein